MSLKNLLIATALMASVSGAAMAADVAPATSATPATTTSASPAATPKADVQKPATTVAKKAGHKSVKTSKKMKKSASVHHKASKVVARTASK